MIAYFIWDRVLCQWIRVVTSLSVWRSIPRAVRPYACIGKPLALAALLGGIMPSPHIPAAMARIQPTQMAAPGPTASLPGQPQWPTSGPAIGNLPGLFPGEGSAGPPAPVVGLALPPISGAVVIPTAATPPQERIIPAATVVPGDSGLPPEVIPQLPKDQPKEQPRDVPEPAGILAAALSLLAITRRFSRQVVSPSLRQGTS